VTINAASQKDEYAPQQFLYLYSFSPKVIGRGEGDVIFLTITGGASSASARTNKEDELGELELIVERMENTMSDK
jgi:hypothetical protein